MLEVPGYTDGSSITETQPVPARSRIFGDSGEPFKGFPVILLNTDVAVEIVQSHLNHGLRISLLRQFQRRLKLILGFSLTVVGILKEFGGEIHDFIVLRSDSLYSIGVFICHNLVPFPVLQLINSMLHSCDSSCNNSKSKKRWHEAIFF